MTEDEKAFYRVSWTDEDAEPHHFDVVTEDDAWKAAKVLSGAFRVDVHRMTIEYLGHILQQVGSL